MAKYKPSKDKKKHIVKKMQETEGLNSGFGEYDESTGGGKPFEAGNSNTRTTRENGKERQAKNPTTNQPRTNDGKFTYKSVNGQSIDPKYGPSRGVTVPPTLTGGENGIKIEDVEEQFSGKSGAYWDKYKDHWYNVGGKVVTVGLSTKISAKAVWEQAKEYDSSLGEYKGESSNWSTKTGRKSKEELIAQEKAKKEKTQQNVIAKEGGIQRVNEKKQGKLSEQFMDFMKNKEKEPEVTKEVAKEEVVSPAPEVENKVEDKIEDKPWGKSGELKERHATNFKAQMKDELGDEYDPELMNDEEIEQFLLGLSPEQLEEIYNYKK